MRIVAVMAAYNEADIIAQSIAHLVEHGIEVHLIDNASTDGTIGQARRFLGRGLLAIETLPRPEGRFSLEAILRRKQALASEIEADWFINQDADEFRESPWSERNLKQGIELVDELGYNAIDFEVLNFWPTHDGYKRGDDLLRFFTRYEAGGAFDRLQIRCWKKPAGHLDLLSSAGHEAAFAGRHVFPIRFLLRHYPVRGQAHGERKIEKERRAAFAPEERARGWHVQYDAVKPGQSFLRDPEALRGYDPERVRVGVALRHRGVEDLERQLAEEVSRREATESTLASVRRDLALRAKEIEALNRAVGQRSEEVEALQAGLSERGQEIERLNASVAELARGLEQRGVEVEALDRAVRETTAALEQRSREVENLVRRLAQTSLALDGEAQRARRLAADLEAARARLAATHASIAWRITAPLRALLDSLQGRKG